MRSVYNSFDFISYTLYHIEMISTDFKQQYEDIEHQLTLICNDKGLKRDELYTFNHFTQGEKFVIMRLLETRAKVVREELLYMHQKYNNVVYLSAYKRGKGTT